MIRATFVMEQHIGHYTFYKNLRHFIDQAVTVESRWVPVRYAPPTRLWHHLPLPRQIKGSLFGRKEVQAGLQHPADITIFNTQVPAILGARSLQQPYVICTDITPRQYDRIGRFYGHSPDRFAPINKLKHTINQRVFQQASYLLPWSHWAKTSLVTEYGANPATTEVLPPCIDCQRWKPTHQESERNKVRLLFVGNDFKRKGGELLLEVFQSLPTELAELTIVTRENVPSIEGVRVRRDLTANSAELITTYQNSDIFVFPTLAEAYGIVAVEACATGLPIIATNNGGLPDVVQHKKNGFLIPPHNTQALRQAILTVANNPNMRKWMGRASRQRAETIFDARIISRRLLQILHTIVNRQQMPTTQQASIPQRVPL